MGIYDREYMRDSPPPSYGGGGNSGLPFKMNGMMAIWIIIGINAVVHLSQMDSYQRTPDGALTASGLKAWKLHQLLTYQFVHAPGLFHILCNMLMLFFVGSQIVRLVGTKQFLAAYFIGGIISGLAELGIQNLSGVDAALIGASGSVSALLGLWALAMPNLRISVLLMFIIPVSGRVFTFGLWWLIINVVLGVVSIFYPTLAVGWFAHAGGTVWGMFQGKFFRPNRGPKRPKPRREKSSSAGSKIVPGDFGQSPEPAYNAVLDKINREGISSLTDKEKQILSDAAEQKGGPAAAD
jgi:membrane associated rhomboid family serine protease